MAAQENVPGISELFQRPQVPPPNGKPPSCNTCVIDLESAVPHGPLLSSKISVSPLPPQFPQPEVIVCYELST